MQTKLNQTHKASRCCFCNGELKKCNNPFEGSKSAIYCEACRIYWVANESGRELALHHVPKVPELMGEAKVPGAPEQNNLRLSIDSREDSHKYIPHFHIYYGKSRSIGYRICDLSPLGNEENTEFIRNKSKVKKYLDIVGFWIKQPSENDKMKTNRDVMLDMYARIWDASAHSYDGQKEKTSL